MWFLEQGDKESGPVGWSERPGGPGSGRIIGSRLESEQGQVLEWKHKAAWRAAWLWGITRTGRRDSPSCTSSLPVFPEPFWPHDTQMNPLT